MRSISNLRIGKKGAGEDIAWPEIIFIVLLLAFMAVFFIFAKDALNGSLIQEEVYAKKIALLIDSAQPNTTISLDVTELNKIAVEAGEKKESFNKMIILNAVNSSNNSVKVSLRVGDKGYSYTYFSTYNVSDGWDSYNDKDGNLKINYILKINENG